MPRALASAGWPDLPADRRLAFVFCLRLCELCEEQRAIGSRATLRCLSGFAVAGGEEELRCEWPGPGATRQVAGYAEWFNLSSLPASGLMCRERPGQFIKPKLCYIEYYVYNYIGLLCFYDLLSPLFSVWPGNCGALCLPRCPSAVLSPGTGVARCVSASRFIGKAPGGQH